MPLHRSSANARHSIRSSHVQPLEQRQLLAAGDLDYAFSSDGVARGYPGFFANDVALQLDGKAVMAGRANGVGAVIRYNIDGSLDTGFGINGLAQLPLLGTIRGVAIDHTSGAILVCSTANGGGDGTHPAVGRLTSGGAVDTGFGNGGYVITDVAGDSSTAKDIVIQRDHKIVIVGDTNDTSGIFLDPDRDFIAIRYNENGSKDNSFGGDGVVQIGMGLQDFANAIAIDYTPLTTSDPRFGSIYLVGHRTEHYDDFDFAIARLTPSGAVDNSYDGDGRVVTSFGGGKIAEAEGATVQPGSKLVVTGTLAVTLGSTQRNFLTARYTTSGAPDPTFGPGANGYVETDFGGNDSSYAIATNFDGGLTVSGQSNGKVALASYLPDGVLDSHFSGDGRHIYNQVGLDSSNVAVRMDVTATYIAPARRIVVAAGNDGQAARVIDVAPVITVTLLDGETSETAGNNASFRVSRTNARPTFQRVFFTTSGVAKKPNTIGSSEYDYTSPNMSFGNGVSSSTYTDIPANQTFVDVAIVGFNDNLTEGDEAAIFTVAPNTFYELGSPSSASIIVRDNEPPGTPYTTAITFHFETLPMTVKFTFSQNVGASLGIDDFFVGPTTHPRPTFGYNSSLNTATLSWAEPLPDGYFGARVIAAGVFNSAGTRLNADSFNIFGFLNGDADRDGTVDFDDLVTLAQNYGETGKTFSQGNFDFSLDGSVAFPDLVILAQRYGRSLAALAQVTLPGSQVKPAGRKRLSVGLLD